jgi:predicted nucleotidyltransferase
MTVERVAVADPAVVQEKIQEMVGRIVAQFAPEKIVLFGSYARGTAGPDSDVDLLVIKPVTGSRRAERVAMRTALRGMGIAKDIVLVTPEEAEESGELVGTVVRPALREGKVLYERPR